jgi:hypothetical protein
LLSRRWKQLPLYPKPGISFMEAPLARNQILNQLQVEYEHIQHLLTGLTADQMLTPNVVGIWSIKDVFAHMVHWNRFPVKEIEYAMRGEDPVPIYDSRDDDDINGEVVAASRTDSLEDVLANFAQSYIEAVHTIEALPDEAFEPNGQVEILLGDTIEGTLNNNTYEHWALHREQIERWLATGETQ